MNTKIGGSELILEAVDLIKDDEIVAFPTETVYGLGANAFSEVAVKKIFVAKGRPQDNPLIIHVDSIEMLAKVAENVSDQVIKLFEMFSPGPLTVIVNKNNQLAPSISQLSTVGVRIPNHPLALELIKRSGVPLAAPSANISTRVSATTAEFVYDDLAGKIPLVLDGGQSEVGLESTIIDMTKEVPIILRPGTIDQNRLLEVLKTVEFKKDQVIIAEAPGMKYKHYSPKVETVMAETIETAVKCYQKNLGLNPVIIGTDQYLSDFPNLNQIALGSTMKSIEKNYFKALRDAEKKYQYIIIQEFDKNYDLAIMNRVLKSTGGKIV